MLSITVIASICHVNLGLYVSTIVVPVVSLRLYTTMQIKEKEKRKNESFVEWNVTLLWFLISNAQPQNLHSLFYMLFEE